MSASNDSADASPNPPIKVRSPGAQSIQMIPIDAIRVLNPRVRNSKAFAAMVGNMSAVGLKRPVTVTEHATPNGTRYDLVCGQGRIEAYRMLAQQTIPAVIVAASEADCYLMSLVENIARRKRDKFDLLSAIAGMHERGDTAAEIARKTGLAPSYVADILILLREGEQRLISAVEQGWLPIRLAIELCRTDDAGLQKALVAAYESGTLRGDQLLHVRRLVERRATFGKNFRRGSRGIPHKSPQALVRAYQAEVRRQRLLIKKAELNERRLIFIITALRTLLSDENFATLLRAEGLDSLPKQVVDQMRELRS
ncbi:MAG: plasmid partitioning protein RepB C-terminal domain-containing protein [Acidobacteriota bacterium]